VSSAPCRQGRLGSHGPPGRPNPGRRRTDPAASRVPQPVCQSVLVSLRPRSGFRPVVDLTEIVSSRTHVGSSDPSPRRWRPPRPRLPPHRAFRVTGRPPRPGRPGSRRSTDPMARTAHCRGPVSLAPRRRTLRGPRAPWGPARTPQGTGPRRSRTSGSPECPSPGRTCSGESQGPSRCGRTTRTASNARAEPGAGPGRSRPTFPAGPVPLRHRPVIGFFGDPFSGGMCATRATRVTILVALD